MRGIPIIYSLRNLWTRRLTTFLTTAGMALVVFVFASILMLAEGLKKTLVKTGSYDNVIVIRKGSGAEVQSGIERIAASIVESQPEIALSPDGRQLVAREIVVLINLQKRGSSKPGQVVIRGTGRNSFFLRPQVKLVKGRLPRPGSRELIAGMSIAKRFHGGDVGETLRFNMLNWQIVGVFDAGNTGFNSEIWGDVEQLMQAFRRPIYSSITFKLNNADFEKVKKRIENDPRLRLEAKRETEYYAEQSEMMAKFIRILGISLTSIFSLGAVIGAMITMYASVSNRVSEIGTLRSLGFQRRNILYAFMFEAILLGLTGGIVGLFFASFLQFFTISTLNFQTFSELAFSFSLSMDIIWKSLLFSTLMGWTGGVLPAFRASRMKIVESMRAV